jgi:hypothetical protein
LYLQRSNRIFWDVPDFGWLRFPLETQSLNWNRYDKSITSNITGSDTGGSDPVSVSNALQIRAEIKL